MKQNKIIVGKNISFLAFVILLGTALIHIGRNAIATYNNTYTSFPWYAAFLFTGIYYIMPLIILLSTYLYFYMKSKKEIK